MNPEKNLFAKNIKYLRNKFGMEQIDLANRLGRKSSSSVSEWEKGKYTPKMGVLNDIAEAFNVSISDLMSSDLSNPNASKKKTDSKIINIPTNTYNYFDTGISAGMLAEVNPFTSDDVEQIALSDVMLGKYAGDKDLIITHVNGESMNRAIPNHSLIAIKKVGSLHDLQNGDIVLFQDGGDMSIKRFYYNQNSNIISFSPDSDRKEFEPIMYRYEDIEQLTIVGKVVVYTVEV